MPAARTLLSTCAVAVLLALSVGCRTASKLDPDVTALLQGITYDASLSSTPESVSSHETCLADAAGAQTLTNELAAAPIAGSLHAPETRVPTTTLSDATLVNKRRSFCKTVGDGVKATGPLVLNGALTVVDAMLGRGDDHIYDSTPRGRADRDLNHWLEARKGWEREARR